MKDHLLPRVYQRLQIAPTNLESHAAESPQSAQNTVVIKNNCIYSHQIAHFYHTTYDVRRSEDIINPKTSHCNIMLLSNSNSEAGDCVSMDPTSTHPFLYGRVIGIYHVNVVYIGPGMKGYKPMHFDFLHTRWFQLDTIIAKVKNLSGFSDLWAPLRLDRLSFPPMADDDSFAFVDPSLVLRSCHLIPAFSMGKRYLDGIGISSMARDKGDWNHYYVNR